jgi:hypothetical protein
MLLVPLLQADTSSMRVRRTARGARCRKPSTGSAIAGHRRERGTRISRQGLCMAAIMRASS